MEIKLGVIDLSNDGGDNLERKQFFKSQDMRPQFCLPKEHHPGWDVYSNIKLSDIGIKASCFSDPAHVYINQNEFELLKERVVETGNVYDAEKIEFEADDHTCATLEMLLDWILDQALQADQICIMGHVFSNVEPPDGYELEEEPYESL